MEEVLREVKRTSGEFAVCLQLLSSSMTIEVTSREDDKVFYTIISGDSMPGELRELYEDYLFE